MLAQMCRHLGEGGGVRRKSHWRVVVDPKLWKSVRVGIHGVVASRLKSAANRHTSLPVSCTAIGGGIGGGVVLGHITAALHPRLGFRPLRKD